MNAVQVNQELRNLIDVEDHKTFIKNCERVLDVLRLTKGMWEELHYAYKAAEIANRVREEAQSRGWNTNHHLQKNALEGIILEANVLAREFRQIQNDQMYGTSLFGGMTDAELAC